MPILIGCFVDQTKCWFPFLLFTLIVCASGAPLKAESGALGIFESSSDVGSVDPPGVASYEMHNYTLSSAGADIWSNQDAFHFLWRKISGDVSLTADISFPITTGAHDPYRKAVLMLRQDLTPDSIYADAAFHGAGSTDLQYRREKGAATQEITLNVSAPKTVRIEKRGDVMTMFLSTTGEPLHQAGASISLPLVGPFYVGIGVSAHNENAIEKAVFSNVELQPLTPPAAPARMALYSTIQTISLDGDAKVVYTMQGHMEAPNWSRDGKSLFFNQDGLIKKISVNGGTPENLNIGAATHCNGSHGLSPDGQWMAISCKMPDKPEARVYVIPSTGGNPRLVTEHPASYFHGWAADGKAIMFVRPDNGSFNIHAIPAEGGEEVALTSGKGVSDDPDCSPDGRYIYFHSDRTGTMQIWRMHLDGSAPEQITFDDLNNWTPHPSPDGRYLVFMTSGKGMTKHPVNDNVSLRIMNLKDKKIRTLVNLVGGSGTINVPSWAPDSQRFAFISYQMLPEENTGSSQ